MPPIHGSHENPAPRVFPFGGTPRLACRRGGVNADCGATHIATGDSFISCLLERNHVPRCLSRRARGVSVQPMARRGPAHSLCTTCSEDQHVTFHISIPWDQPATLIAEAWQAKSRFIRLGTPRPRRPSTPCIPSTRNLLHAHTPRLPHCCHDGGEQDRPRARREAVPRCLTRRYRP